MTNIAIKKYLREPLTIHFGGQANLFDSGRRQTKAALATTKADLSSLPEYKKLLLAAQKQLLELPLILSLFIVSASVCFSQTGTIEQIIRRNGLTDSSFGILAVEAGSGNVLYQKNASQPMIPASNMKVVTTAAALHYLGNDYSFQTKIGLLDRNLVIVGGGDPLFGDPKNESYGGQMSDAIMQYITETIKKHEITRIDNIIIDTSFFDSHYVHSSWPQDQLNQWYACEISGLNFYTNCIHLTASRMNDKVSLDMVPGNTFVTLVNQVKLISGGSSAVGAYRNSIPNKLIIKGRLNKQAGFDVAIENPAGLFASILKDTLEASGVRVHGSICQEYVKNDSGIRYLAIIKTPIEDVLVRCNKNSLGLAAESLVKTISAENTKGRINGEWPHGLTLVSRYLESLGISKEEYILDDGSGLSRNNRLSPHVLVTVLMDVYKSPSREMYINSLAEGGVDGTISGYFREPEYKGKILGKTGYISKVRSFSGICRTPRGDVFFSILNENGNGNSRRCINDITKAIFDGSY